MEGIEINVSVLDETMNTNKKYLPPLCCFKSLTFLNVDPKDAQ